MRRLAIVIATLALAGVPASASAAVEPLPDDVWVLPSDGFQRPLSSWPNATNFEMFDFTVYADFEDGEFDVEVATSPSTDPDGTLADAKRVDHYVAPVDPRVPAGEVFTARTDVGAQWLSTLGTYYWQAYYHADDGTVWATKVQSIVITERPPADPPSDPPLERTSPAQVSSPAPAAQVVASTAKQLSRSSARAILRRAIREQAGRSPQRLASSCSLPTPHVARCNLTWRDARYRYRAKATLTSTTGGMLARFDGTRTRRECTRRCRSAIHWSVATTARRASASCS